MGAADDGSTIILPNDTSAPWTQGIIIANRIKIHGQTTCHIPWGASVGPDPVTNINAQDKSVIIENIPGRETSPIFKFTNQNTGSTSFSPELSGVTFKTEVTTRDVTGLSVTGGSTTISGLSNSFFKPDDEGKQISATTRIPAGPPKTTIVTVAVGGASATMSAAATGTGSATITATVGNPVTKAQDGMIKFSTHCHNVVIHDCHFDRIAGHTLAIYGDNWGVMYNNILDFAPGSGEGITVQMGDWDTTGTSTGANGDQSYADELYYGTNKAFFIESNYLQGNGTDLNNNGGVDSEAGGRIVFRYNTLLNDAGVSGHGTESGGRMRGMRSAEVYGNQITITAQIPAGIRRGTEERSGSNLQFNNVWQTSPPNLGGIIGRPLRCYRYFTPTAYWGGAGGPNSSGKDPTHWWDVVAGSSFGTWDKLATTGSTGPASGSKGTWTHSDGAAPVVFEEGQAINPVVESRILRVNDKDWRGKDWSGYTLINLDETKTLQGYTWPYGNFIISNTKNDVGTENTMTCSIQTNNGNLQWNNGNNYRIYKVMSALDMVGMGKGDLITNTSANDPTPKNTAHGNVAYPPGNQLEGSWAWNNTNNGVAFTTGGVNSDYIWTDEPDLFKVLLTPPTPRGDSTKIGHVNLFAPTKQDILNASPSTPQTGTNNAFDASNNYIGYKYPHELVPQGPIAPSFTSAPSVTLTQNVNCTSGPCFTVTTSGTAPITVTKTSGTVPGLTINNGTGTATITGTPTTVGQTNITYSATNSVGSAPPYTLTINVSAGNAPPICNWSLPTAGTKTPGSYTTTLTATASDTTKVTKVEFYADSGSGFVKLGEDVHDSPAGSATYTWGQTFTTGTYNLKARAYDDTTPTALTTDSTPTVQIVVPVAMTAPTITSSALATFANGGTGDFIVTTTGTAPVTITRTGTLPANVTFTAATPVVGQATFHDAGSTATGDWPQALTASNGTSPNATQNLTIRINAGNTAPFCNWSLPTSGTTTPAPYNTTLTATASDPDGLVTKVDFYDGATLLGTDSHLSNVSTTYTLAHQFLAGIYNLKATATDNNGTPATTTSSPTVQITVPNGSGGAIFPAGILIRQ